MKIKELISLLESMNQELLVVMSEGNGFRKLKDIGEEARYQGNEVDHSQWAAGEPCVVLWPLTGEHNDRSNG